MQLILTTTTYDPAGRVTRLINCDVQNTNIANSLFTYTYDNTANRTGVLERNGDQVTWTYDKTYQLTNESRSGAHAYNTTYTYDPVGNRLVKDDSSALTTSTYDAANQLQTSVAAAGTTTYTFDGAGNQHVAQESHRRADHQHLERREPPHARPALEWDREHNHLQR